MPEAKEKLRRLEELFKVANEGLSEKKFDEAFESIIRLILKVESDLIKKHNTRLTELKEFPSELAGNLKNLQEQLAKKLQTNNDESLLRLKSDVDKILDQLNQFSQVNTQKIDKALREQERGMNFIRDKVRKIKEGDDGDPGKDGHTPTKDELLALIEPLIPEIEETKEETPEEHRNKLEQLEGDERLPIEAIKGWDELIKRVERSLSSIPRGGGTSAMGVAQAFKYIAHTEEPVGNIDGSNLIYTVSKDIWWIAGFTLNGENIAELPNYTFAGKTITFSSALPAVYSGKDFECKFIG